jgi:hypothetical protein
MNSLILRKKIGKPENHLRLIHSVFPNSSISANSNEHCLVSKIFPSPGFTRDGHNSIYFMFKGTKTKKEIKRLKNLANK